MANLSPGQSNHPEEDMKLFWTGGGGRGEKGASEVGGREEVCVCTSIPATSKREVQDY